MNLITMLNVCSSKDTIRKIKMQATDYEEILANLVFDKGIIFRVFWVFFFRKHIYTSQEDKQPDILNEQEI